MPEYRFPEAFLEFGKDEDHSYKSLRTTRQPDGRLKIDVEGWGIAGYGLFLEAERGEKAEMGEILKLCIMGECGTIFSKAWKKVLFSRVLEKEDENNFGQIMFWGYAPAEVGQIVIQLILNIETYQTP